MDRRPVKGVKNRSDVLLSVSVGSKTGSSVLHKLKVTKRRLGDANIKCIAVV